MRRILRAGWAALLITSLCGLEAGCDRPRLSQRLRQRALELSAKGHEDEAAAVLERAIAYDPNDAIALERLFALRVRSGRGGEVLRYAPLVRDLAARSASLEKLLLRAEIQGDLLESALAQATELEQKGRLDAVVEKELSAALAARSVSGWVPPTTLSDRFAAAVARALIARKEFARAASLLENRTPTPARDAVKQELLIALYERQFDIDDAALDRLTNEPRNALECLGRLELLLRTSRGLEASRLELSDEGRTPELLDAWNGRWAGHFARLSDWYGVLARTEQPRRSAKNEARRRALRTAAHQGLRDRSAARAELAAWSNDAAAWQHWPDTLLLPELASHRDELTELRLAWERRPRH